MRNRYDLNLVKVIRIVNDMSKIEFSNFTGILPSLVCQIEQGTRNLSSKSLTNILTAFDITNEQYQELVEYKEYLINNVDNKELRWYKMLIKTILVLDYQKNEISNKEKLMCITKPKKNRF